jgi:DNA-binding XRE family transcriptional regulator
LVKLRINAGLSPNELGIQAGVSGKTIRDAEEGRTVPLPRTQFAIARVFDRLPTEIWPLNGGGRE